MKINTLSPIVTTEKIEQCKAFYMTHFDFKIVFESPGHLCLGAKNNSDLTISFMAPEQSNAPFSGSGLMFCLEVDDVDREYEGLDKCLEMVRPLQDNPWGDRSFSVSDPTGAVVYIYKKIEPCEEFKDCYK